MVAAFQGLLEESKGVKQAEDRRSHGRVSTPIRWGPFILLHNRKATPTMALDIWYIQSLSTSSKECYSKHCSHYVRRRTAEVTPERATSSRGH
jgi:hypothetical protein